MLHAIIKKFPQTIIDEKSPILFSHLVTRLVNDDDSKVRTMIGVAIKLLIGRVSQRRLDSILNYSLSLYFGSQEQVWATATGAMVKHFFFDTNFVLSRRLFHLVVL